MADESATATATEGDGGPSILEQLGDALLGTGGGHDRPPTISSCSSSSSSELDVLAPQPMESEESTSIRVLDDDSLGGAAVNSDSFFTVETTDVGLINLENSLRDETGADLNLAGSRTLAMQSGNAHEMHDLEAAEQDLDLILSSLEPPSPDIQHASSPNQAQTLPQKDRTSASASFGPPRRSLIASSAMAYISYLAGESGALSAGERQQVGAGRRQRRASLKQIPIASFDAHRARVPPTVTMPSKLSSHESFEL